MVNLLLAVIYAAFISLGLPDALLGSAWPSMYKIMDVPVSYAGVVSMIISCGTVISSFMSDRVVRKLGTHLVSVISVALCGTALLFIPVELCAFIGLIFIGVGCAPIYPGLLHQTPVRFGAKNAQAIMGMQMACAYIGSMTMPALFGKLSDFFGMQLYPTLLLAFAGMLAFAVWNANRLTIDHR